MEITHRWAEECLQFHSSKDQLLFGICQGGLYEDIRRKSAEFISSLKFDGYAIGGIKICRTMQDKMFVVSSTTPFLPKNKVRYAMGVGNPLEIIEMVLHGVDLFDSAYPSILATQNLLLTYKGLISSSQNGSGKDSDLTINNGMSLWELCKLQNENPKEALRIRISHNVSFLNSFMNQIRVSICEGCIEEFAEKVRHVFWGVSKTGF